MGRVLIAVITLLVWPTSSNACEGDNMTMSVKQVGPQIKVVEKKRKADFILFRGDMAMQKEEARIAKEEQQREQVAEAIEAAQANEAAEPPFIKIAAQPEEAPSIAPIPVPKARPTQIDKPQVRTVKNAIAAKASSKKNVAKNSAPAKANAKAGSKGKNIAKAIAAKKVDKKVGKLTDNKVGKTADKKVVAKATAKPKKHRIERSPASIGPAIVVATQD